MNSSINASAKILNELDITPDNYNFGNFKNENNNSKTKFKDHFVDTIVDKEPSDKIVSNIESDKLQQNIENLFSHLQNIENKITNLENSKSSSNEIDKQIIHALQDLQNHGKFFDKGITELETKILKTSIAIAKKIIGIEVSQNSFQIAQITLENILNKIKDASQITIHLHPKDYLILKDNLNLATYIKLQEDNNVSPGGVVVSSNLGNFDGNVEAKIASIVETLEGVL